MNRIILALIWTILLVNAHITSAQEISEGTYTGYRGGIIPKYIIMVVNGDCAQFEMFTRWQGVWLPCIGEWNASYEPQLLQRKPDGSWANENVAVGIVHNKNVGLKGIAQKTFAGKVNFSLVKQEVLPDGHREVKAKAMEFVRKTQDIK